MFIHPQSVPLTMARTTLWPLMRLQLQCLNTLTLGLMDDYTQELEHALVEGKAIGDELTDALQTIAQIQEPGPEQQAQVTRCMQHAESQLSQLFKDTSFNLAWLPLTRFANRPARRRFPVTLEGEYQLV